MDKDTRNLLFNTTQAIRRLLEEEFSLQLEGTFDVHADGRIAEQPGSQLSASERLVRGRIVEAIQHRLAVGESAAEAVRGFQSEAVFTFLNRLAALKMMEARALVLPCVSQGDQSQGFKEFSGLAPGLIELPDKGYRLYLECLFDEIGREVGILFDRTDAASQLWPRRKALEAVLAKLNTPELAGVWAEDETIGWIYQYYNDPEERALMRDPKRGGSAAPRNSRELAVRNQFFTPRYVVEFLTDNTLGRLWYEMTQGRTGLKEQCRYLVRRPHEIFLGSHWPDMNPVPSGSWVERVAQGALTDLPEQPTRDELDALAFLVDGYAEAERRGWPDVFAHCGEILTAHFEHGKPLPEDLHLIWLCLFSCVRGRVQRFFPRGHEPAVHDALYAAWRRLALAAGETGDQAELLRRPVLIPHRPLKDPREIRLLDPACGSMHFGLYAFDLFEVIYQEAFRTQPHLRRTFLSNYGWCEHESTAFDPKAVRLNPDVPAWSAYHNSEIPVSQAWVVVAEEADGGDGVRQGYPYLVEASVKFRVPFAHRVKLVEFDYATALREGWFDADTGASFFHESRCFTHAPTVTPAVTEAEAERAFLRDIPRLILEHNIHGIDIDPRAAQIAGLALWLRAQKSWQRLGLKPADRPAIRRSNIVCAEPMPGEKELLREFVEQQFPAAERPLFQAFLESVGDRMRLAGEAGSLLQIEDEIRGLVAEAKQRWKDRPRFEQTTMFPGLETKPQQEEMRLDVSGITDEQFWENMEERVYAALRTFAERSESAGGFQRRLFAEDAARGFAFIDLCRQRYDVALMNPPFGDASLPSKPYLDDTYGDTKGDVYKAFVECFQARLVPAGFLGIISSRTGFFLGQSEDWRTRVVLRLFRPIALADLGMGVLDAMVEVAAYVLRSLSAPEARDLTLSLVPVLEKVALDKQDRFSLPKWQAARGGLKRHQAVAELEHLDAHGFVQRSSGDTVRYTPLWHLVKKVTAPPKPVFPPFVCVRALDETAKGEAVFESLSNSDDPRKFVSNPGSFFCLPGTTFAYWASPRLLQTFTATESLQNSGFEAWVGLQTNQDFRWLRLMWEVCESVYPAPANRGEPRCWLPFAKGGEYSPFYSDIHLVVLWGTDGWLLKEWKKEELRRGRITENNSQCWNESHYQRLGLTWPRRSQIGLSVRVMPAGCLFGDKGPGIFTDDASPTRLLAALGIANSTPFKRLVALQMAFGSFEVGVLRRTPYPHLSYESESALSSAARKVWVEKRWLDTIESTSNAFFRPALIATSGSTLAERATAWAARVRTSEESVAAIQAEIDELAFRLYGLDAADRAALTSTLATEATGEAEVDADEEEEEEANAAEANELTADLLAYALGCAFGRWDVRYATGERLTPEPPDPFAPLPVCPPGQLQNPHGLPARPEDVPASYPIRIPWDGILVDDANHPGDVIERVRETLRIIWKERAEAIEHEACEILGVKFLRDWFRKPTGFFADHIKRYSKSRRQAPIYWPLSSPNGLYTVWLYYHRLTADTLFTVLRDYLKPKLEFEERSAFQLRQEAGTTPSPSQRRDIAEGEALVEDLRAFKSELERVAPLFRPNLNDGVIINYAPLWRVIGLPKWRKDCQAIWNELAKGDYDWAHLAMHLWPERVVPKCATDRSLAIAHGLEEVFWQEDPEKPGKWIARKVTELELRGLIAERTSAAVKAAVDSLVELPNTPVKPGKRKNV